MKILYLITSFEAGGAEFAIADIVTAIREQGHDVHVLACEPRDLGAVERLEKANISYDLLCKKRRSKWIVLVSLLKEIQRFKPDVILTSLNRATAIGQQAGYLCKIPVVSFKNSTFCQRSTHRQKALSKLWIADSCTVVDTLKNTLGIAPSRIMNWPLYYCDVQVPSALPWDGVSPLKMGSLGRLCPQKNYTALLDGLKLFSEQHPQWAAQLRVTILGDGEQRDELEAQIKRQGLEDIVALPGYSSAVSEFLAEQHVYIQPSTFEGLCIAVHEAMNSGLPIIATPVGEIKNSVVEGESGFILNTEQIAASLCETLTQIFTSPHLLKEYGEAAQGYVRTAYSQTAFKQTACDILERMAQRES